MEYMKFRNESDFNSVICKEDDGMFLFKNFPNYNVDSRQFTEFCLINKINDIIDKGRIECRHQDVSGSTHEKNPNKIMEYRNNKINWSETFFILICDGKHYEKNPKYLNGLLKEVEFDYDILILSFKQFQFFLSDYLNSELGVSNVIKKHKELTKINNK